MRVDKIRTVKSIKKQQGQPVRYLNESIFSTIKVLRNYDKNDRFTIFRKIKDQTILLYSGNNEFLEWQNLTDFQ